MKRALLAFFFLAASAFGQIYPPITIQKTQHQDSPADSLTPTSKIIVVPSGGSITIGSGASLNAGSGAMVNFTGATQIGIVPSSMPWANLTSIPSPTISWTGDVTGAATLSASGGVSNALSVAKIQGTAVSGTTGSGNVVFSTSPTLVTPTLGAATATSVNGLTISSSSGTLTVGNGSTLSTSGAYSIALTATGNSSLTLPTSGLLATVSGGSHNVPNGTTTVSPAGSIDTEALTLTGSAGATNVVLSTSPTPATGALCDLVFSVPATSGIVVSVYSGSTGGALLQSFTTTGTASLTSATMLCYYLNGQWTALFYQGPIP